MKPCRNFLIVSNTSKDQDMQSALRLQKIIDSSGCFAELVRGDSEETLTRIPSPLLEKKDAVVTLGGDGTMLRVSHAIEGTNLPMIGVNLGTVGFLTEVQQAGMKDMIQRLMAGDYRVEERMMLAGQVYGQQEDGRYQPAGLETYALNDVVLAREDALQLIAVEIYVNGKFFDRTEADGIIISTPTGSTGYNLSAGGPIVNSDARLLVLTPISPYSLSRRSVVFGAEDRIVMKLVQKRKNGSKNGIASFDGYQNFRMKAGDYVEVYGSGKALHLIKLDDASVYEILRKKLGG